MTRNSLRRTRPDLAASIQKVIVDVLLKKLVRASHDYQINDIAVAGGVSANSRLRKSLQQKADELGWRVFIPKFEYCTDNAAMVAITGYFKYLRGFGTGILRTQGRGSREVAEQVPERKRETG